ncbi:P-loop containing nucleoside triphosphate hydrolase protein [Radiomyces spectabilis]|uniref:P-loop containing nucleoside triphosphate hydrolase protein n=1 Tax=Radiomyces spectabilis TaxID=64574 RepID=UPI00221FE2E8|nr:P-loop containing nucleoside triphosphate hydrolase protein [Radiomyces spectabilis]KAI8379654.1 P-loop containing nucleoside triphosphate hydrolase protein [Radiomyces spectabilis]
MAIGLSEGQKINVEFCRNVADCVSVHVEPYTEDDWEILELHAGYVEENLLSQIRVVYTNQLMCVWIHGRTLVRLRVAQLDPQNGYVKLNTNSEVIVAPKVRKSTKPADIAAQQLSSVKQQKAAPSVCLRTFPQAIPVPGLPVTDIPSVIIHPDSMGEVAGHTLARITKVIPGFSRRDTNNEENHETTAEPILQTKAVYVSVIPSNAVPIGHILVAPCVRQTLEIKDFDYTKVSVVTHKKSSPGALILRRFVTSTTNPSLKIGLDAQNQAQQKAARDNQFIEKVQEWLSSVPHETLVLTQGITLTLPGDPQEQCLIQFGQKKGLFSSSTNNTAAPLEDLTEEYAVMSVAQWKKLALDIGEDIPQASENAKTKSAASHDISMGGVQKLLDKLRQYTIANVAEKELKDTLSIPSSGGVLITGAHGSGKTSLVKKLIHSVSHDPSALIYALEINCAEIAEERIPTLKDMLQKWFDEAAWHAPSVIFFDDFDRLIPAEVEHADSTRSRHLAELFFRLASTMTKRHSIAIIATSQQQQSVHPSLVTNHVFSELKHLNPPNRDERKEILRSIMADGPEILTKSLPRIDLVSVASETEGYLAADLKALVERAVHEGAVRSIKKDLDAGLIEQEHTPTFELKQEDFTKARDGFVPSSLRGVKLQSSGVQWSDIGGLNETRKALLETLEWPTKYAAVFSQCPLRLRSGVKGPEILNKYIGASEKSVRDLFERAQAAKPCVLFFDEFDSIAPRRGHDSTGVTDRVVNQMLTQMDGAEGLDGVYVLAATSRPDLIDPALLRPGRLDKALLCGMPSFGERLEILEALSHKMTLASDVDLRVYAEKTEGFSGADLQGFLYNAHLEAIHGAINIDSFRDQQSKTKEASKNEDKSDFIMIGQVSPSSAKAPLTRAEKGQISQRLAMIKKGVTRPVSSKKQDSKQDENNKQAPQQHVAQITAAYLEKSLKATRPSITEEERQRLQAIYNEFVTGRTGELPSGEGAKGVGKRTTLG